MEDGHIWMRAYVEVESSPRQENSATYRASRLGELLMLFCIDALKVLLISF